ncbi:MAG: zinc ribbon domain-containing protein [Phycisphaerales bacterium]|nr:zinc ribbon domain-containing protein [Phycisphaerales bacterium]
MPTYDYRCTACKHQWEEFQSITAKPLKKCPACGKAKAERLIGMGAAVVFKGGGFYQTDYRSEAYKAAAKADAGSADGAAKPASDSAASSTSSRSPSRSDRSSKPSKARLPPSTDAPDTLSS